MVIKVKKLTGINTTLYKEGTLFSTDRQLGILHNGKIEPLLKRSDVKKMIQDELKKKEVKNNVTT